MFKNSFSIQSSSLALREAFAKEAEALGWINQDKSVNPLYESLYFNASDKGAALKDGHFWNAESDSTLYKLPEQWNEALKAASELVEEEKFILTSEDEVYEGAEKEKVKIGEIYFRVHSNNEISEYTLDKTLQESIIILKGTSERFASRKAAEDYVLLQKAIKDSGLKVGTKGSDVNGIFEDMRYKSSAWLNNSWNGGFSDSSIYTIKRFRIYNGIPCAFVYFSNSDELIFYIFPLDQFSKNIEIGDFHLEIREEVSQKVAAFGCQDFTSEDIDFLLRMLTNPIRASIKIRNVEITREMLLTIKRALIS